jgi:hypothetical protein
LLSSIILSKVKMSVFNSGEIQDLLISSEKDLVTAITLHGYDEGLLKNSESPSYLKAYVLFAHFSERVKFLKDFSELDRLYNQYYWLRQICRFTEKRTDSDKGISQQLFQLIEEMDHAGDEVNWELIESIDKGEIYGTL